METPLASGWHDRQGFSEPWFWNGAQWTESASQWRERMKNGTTPKTPARKSKTGLVVGAVVALVALLVGIGIGGAGKAENTATAQPTVTVTVANEKVAAPAVTVTVTSEKPAATVTKQAAAPAPETAFSDGTYLVGPDIAPGTYRTRSAVTSGSCYWSIGKPGASLPDQNEIVSGGKPTVILKAGKEFVSTRCGDWIKTR